MTSPTKSIRQIQHVRDVLRAATAGKPFPIAAVPGLPIWRTASERTAAEVVVRLEALELPGGLVVFQEDAFDIPTFDMGAM